jgi:hypothetical protein
LSLLDRGDGTVQLAHRTVQRCELAVEWTPRRRARTRCFTCGSDPAGGVDQAEEVVPVGDNAPGVPAAEDRPVDTSMLGELGPRCVRGEREQLIDERSRRTPLKRTPLRSQSAKVSHL